MLRPDTVVGWDIGGAHVKASQVEDGRLLDVAQWPCPLWQGLDHLQGAVAAARARWPRSTGARHAITMTGEMVDLFAHREAGVRMLAEVLAGSLDGPLHFYAGALGWCGPAEAGPLWAAIASANWFATAQLAAQAQRDALLVDIGSTTSDVIALRGSRVAAQGHNDARRLACGELVYQGVVRTPLCALGPRIALRGEPVNVMNELFATSADVYRLTGELDAAHDQQPSADGAAKDAAATRQRLARMVGLDARDLGEADALALAQAWRAAQLAELRANVERVIAHSALPDGAPLIGAGCGDFLVEALAAALRRPYRRFADIALDAADADAGALARWAQVGAPSVAVALLCGRAAAVSA
jgi:probable H4MPT-linked C1 transfer pathway protein